MIQDLKHHPGAVVGEWTHAASPIDIQIFTMLETINMVPGDTDVTQFHSFLNNGHAVERS